MNITIEKPVKPLAPVPPHIFTHDEKTYTHAIEAICWLDTLGKSEKFIWNFLIENKYPPKENNWSIANIRQIIVRI